MASNKQDKARLRSIALAERTAKRRYFVSIYGTGDLVESFDLQGRKTILTLEEAVAVERAALPWRVHCYALCRHPIDGDYIREAPTAMAPNGGAKQNDLHRSLSHFHFDWMQKECNLSQVLTLAWIATTADDPGELAIKMFGDAWDLFDPIIREGNGAYITCPREAA